MQIPLTKPIMRPFREGLASSQILRAIVLPLLRRIDRPITITNPFAGLPFHLLSYTHKGYWFYGKHREAETMERLSRLTRGGDTVFEVGGDIGSLTQFFAKKVGQKGQIHVFEPGQENQHFLRKNIARCAQCIHINAAVSNRSGKAMFYEENMGGFMNSLEADFAATSDIADNQRNALQINARRVNTVTLDAYALAHNVWPNVLKIDVEGAELAVLRGAGQVLENVRSLMIEVTRNHREVFEILDDHEFMLTQPDGTPITDPSDMHGNVFATREA